MYSAAEQGVSSGAKALVFPEVIVGAAFVSLAKKAPTP
jgi:hypothetical protein